MGLPQRLVEKVIRAFLYECVNFLVKGRTLQFRGFGTFEVVYRPPRTGRDLRRGVPCHIPARHVVVFRPGTILKAAVHEKGGNREGG